MTNQPWNEKVTDRDETVKKLRRTSEQLISTPVMTILFSIFFVIIIAIVFIIIYTSTGGSDKKRAQSAFYGGASESLKLDSSTTSSSSSGAKTTTSSSRKGRTITVLPGEGAASIASRAQITVEELESLNPEHMTQGYWYADPGDEVYIE